MIESYWFQWSWAVRERFRGSGIFRLCQIAAAKARSFEATRA